MEALNLKDDIDFLVNQIKDPWSLSQFCSEMHNAFEAETLVARCIHLCKRNIEQTGEIFAFLGDKFKTDKFESRGNHRFQVISDPFNAYQQLIEKGYFEEKQQGKKTVVVPTEKLIMELKKYFEFKNEVASS